MLNPNEFQGAKAHQAKRRQTDEGRQGNGAYGRYKPVNLTRAQECIEIRGVIDRAYAYERTKDHKHQQYHGPDLCCLTPDCMWDRANVGAFCKWRAKP